jgi:hypothetical protein
MSNRGTLYTVPNGALIHAAQAPSPSRRGADHRNHALRNWWENTYPGCQADSAYDEQCDRWRVSFEQADGSTSSEEFNAVISACGSPHVDSWYKNDSGRVSQNWPGTHGEWWQQTRQPDLEDFHAG